MNDPLYVIDPVEQIQYIKHFPIRSPRSARVEHNLGAFKFVSLHIGGGKTTGTFEKG